MSVLHNVRMESSNVKKNNNKKKKRTTKCDKSIVKYYVGTTRHDNGTIKCEKK